MGLFGAMTASVAGLNVQGQAISVISDNLANTNTTGYKASRSLFSQLVTSSGVSGTAYNAGGVGVDTQRAQAVQGSLNGTSSKTDLAITGNGYFRVSDSKEISTSTGYYYTRAGSFAENKEGYLVNPDGYFLQGWPTDGDGKITNLQNLSNIELQSVGVSSQETSNVKLGVTLNRDSQVATSLYDTTQPLANSLNNILASNNSDIFLSDVRVYDSQGGARDLTVAFSKRADNLWDYQVYTDGKNIQGGTPDAETRVGSGTMEFNSNGTLKNVTGNTLTINWADGVTPSTITLDLGQATGGKVATSTGGLGFTNGVMGLTAENGNMAVGPYSVRWASTTGGVATLELVSGGAVVATGTMSTSATARQVVFDNGTNKVRLSVSANFDADGTGVAGNVLGTFTVADVAADRQGVGTDGIQQKAASSNTSFTNQDGFGAGLLSAISIGEDGYVSGTFTNGETKKLYKIAIGVFQNQNGLEAVSGSLLRPTDSSGAALIKEAGVGGTGRIVSGALEGSTTDIANEFSQMIVAQRAFQANSSVIQTVDQMLNNLLQLR